MKIKIILVTGASGKTGRMVINSLLGKNYSIRAMIHDPCQAQSFGNEVKTLVGDMTSRDDLEHAMAGINAVYHICPNMHPDEVGIGKLVIQASQSAGIDHFVYHSVLHPQVREMPHHWNKMRVEGILFKSGLNFTILQPTAYYQNLLQYKKAIIEQGVYSVPYNGDTRIGMVDLADVAEVAALVIGQPSHFGGIYELATDKALTQKELTVLINQVTRREVHFEETPREKWEADMGKTGMNDYARATLLRMFEYYEQYGLYGNGMVLSRLLGRAAASIESFIKANF